MASRMASAEDKYTVVLPRKCPKEIIEMEERERQRRAIEGINPIMMARMFHVQQELLYKWPTTTITARLREGVKLHGLAESAKHWVHNLGEKASDLIHSAKEKMMGHQQPGHFSTVKAPTAGTMKEVSRLEEEERTRRLHEGVNPSLQQKRIQVQSELKQSVPAK